MLILTLRNALRHVPEAGAVCGSSARTDLCGGWQETAIPTATSDRIQLSQRWPNVSGVNSPTRFLGSFWVVNQTKHDQDRLSIKTAANRKLLI